MDTFFDVPWRHGPALALIVLGIALTGQGLGRLPNPIQPRIDLMVWLRAFRRVTIGLAVGLVGLAWLWHVPWLLAVALGVGLQEIREASHYITTLQTADARRGPATHQPDTTVKLLPSPLSGSDRHQR